MSNQRLRKALNFGSTLSAVVWVAILVWTLAAWRYHALALSDIKPLAIFVGQAVVVFALLGTAAVLGVRVLSRGESNKKGVTNLNVHWWNLVFAVLSLVALWVLLIKLDWLSLLTDRSADGWPYLLAGFFLIAQAGNYIDGHNWFRRSAETSSDTADRPPRRTSSSSHDTQTVSMAEMMSQPRI